MSYITKDMHYSAFPEQYKQNFFHPFTLNVSYDVVVKLRNAEKITDLDLDIVRFLYKFKFATEHQLKQLFGDKVHRRLSHMLDRRLINGFSLSQAEGMADNTDALLIYCMDLGGKYLLDNYTNEDTSEWYSSTNMKTSELIARHLFNVDIYTRMSHALGSRLLFFETVPQFALGKTSLRPSFEMGMRVGSQVRYFWGDYYTERDFPNFMRERIEKLSQFYKNPHAWKKYYPSDKEPPILLLFADKDLTALDAGKFMYNLSEMDNFRLSTVERIERPLHELGSFMRYVSERDKLKEVRANTFGPPKQTKTTN